MVLDAELIQLLIEVSNFWADNDVLKLYCAQF